jgi:hypothetical protein
MLSAGYQRPPSAKSRPSKPVSGAPPRRRKHAPGICCPLCLQGHQSGGYWRFERFAGDRCRVQVQVHCANERIYCPSSVDRSASRTVCRPLRVFVPSNALARTSPPIAYTLAGFRQGADVSYHLCADLAEVRFASSTRDPRDLALCCGSSRKSPGAPKGNENALEQYAAKQSPGGEK